MLPVIRLAARRRRTTPRCDFAWLAEPSLRRAVDPAANHLARRVGRGVERHRDLGRGDRVDPHAARRPFDGEAAGELVHRCVGRFMIALRKPMLTMLTLPVASMCCPNARAHQNVPLSLTSGTFSQCSSATTSVAVSLRAIPALLTSTSTAQSRSATSVTRAESVTSSCTGSTAKPFAEGPRSRSPAAARPGRQS